MFKRITLFLLINILVLLTVSFVLSFFHVQPYLKAYGLNYQSLMIFCLVWGMAGALISLMLSRVMAKWTMGVKLIDANSYSTEYRQLYATVERLAHAANLPITPQVGIFNSAIPNAFATGPTKKRSLVAVSTGLLQTMSPSQLEAIIGHEITHISNGDMVTMTLLQGVINAFVMFLARVLAFALSGIGKNQKQSSSGSSYASYYIFTFVFEILFMILGSMVIAAYSRRREFRADHGGARLSSRAAMISALQALQHQVVHTKEEPTQVAALQAFMINSTKKSSILQLFATHPPLEKRIERLSEDHDLT